MVKHAAKLAGELELTERLRRRAALPAGSSVILGIGDDCAIFRPRGAQEDLLFTTDLLVEDVHFRRAGYRPADVGWKALARGLSDIAAMGGVPRFCLVSLAVPAGLDSSWINNFYRGLLRLARREATVLAGGDLSRADKITCDIVAAGSVPRGKALRRDGARPGDSIYVSGNLGGAALALAKDTHRRVAPRLALGRFLRERLGATSAMDLSDGLSLDLHRLCRASRLAAEIAPPPAFPGATLEHSLHGGEDYELLFTVTPRTTVPRSFEGVRLTRIGAVHRGRPGAILLDGTPLTPMGYDHFAQSPVTS